MSGRVFESLRAKLEGENSEIIRSQAKTLPKKGIEVTDFDEEGPSKPALTVDAGNLSLEHKADVRVPEHISSNIDHVQGHFETNYTNQPCSVLGVEKNQDLRLRKPSNEFLKVMHEVKSLRSADKDKQMKRKQANHIGRPQIISS